MLQARIRDGAFSFRTSSGALLRVAIHDLDARAQDETQKLIVKVDGAYNGEPVRFERSRAVLRRHARQARPAAGRNSRAATATAEAGFSSAR